MLVALGMSIYYIPIYIMQMHDRIIAAPPEVATEIHWLSFTELVTNNIDQYCNIVYEVFQFYEMWTTLQECAYFRIDYFYIYLKYYVQHSLSGVLTVLISMLISGTEDRSPLRVL